MLFSLPVCLSFWYAVWAAPLRVIDGDLFARVALPDLPRWPVVRRLGPLCVQRWVACTVVAHLAWRREFALPVLWRYGRDSVPDWSQHATMPCSRESRRGLSDERLCWLLGLEVELVARILCEPGLVSLEERLAALAGTCARIARMYEELRRRYHAAQARVIFCAVSGSFPGSPAQVA